MRVINFDDGFTSAAAPTLVGIDAADVAVTPSGNLGSTDAQAALVELQGDINTINAALTPHLADTSTHGTTGDIVGTSDAQALTNKTLVVASNTVTTAAAGNLVSTELNAALNELQLDIDSRINAAGLAVATQVGLGNVDNTSNATERAASATLTNKTIDADLNTITNIINADIKAAAGIVDTKLATIATAGKVSNSATTAASANTASAS